MLVSGLASYPGPDGRLSLERTGPFVPPITLAGISDLIVTDDFRHELERSELRGFSFRDVIVKRVVKLDWRSWDLNAPEPARYPAGSEPENYVLGRKHNPATAAAVGRLWEVVIDHVVDEPGDADLVRTAPTRFSSILASDKAREWLAQNAGEWLVFDQE